MTLSKELEKRGLVYQYSSEKLADIFDSDTKRTVYLGIDPTAESIHVGHLVPYMLLNHLLRAGHKVILLVGGGTALIGDPSGRDSERDFVDVAVVKQRAKALEKQIKNITSSEIRFVNNYDWLSKLSLVEFLRDVGKHFTVNAMVKKDAVSARLHSENGISYTEFSYALLQSYDYFHLHKKYGCDVQIGASDQWGNISSGIDYIRRMTGKEVHGLTLPLLINPSTGKKFGKSEGNAIWLDPSLTTPYQFYQFWYNTPDQEVGSYIRKFTFKSLEEIESLEEQAKKDPGERTAQKVLAHEVTAFVHGEKIAEEVRRATEILFGADNIATLGAEERKKILSHVPTHEIASGTDIVEVLTSSGLAKSKA